MPIYRAILKKTKYFSKGVLGTRSGRYLSRYLERYVDEVEKARQKKGERTPGEKTQGEAIWLLPEEATGKFWSGGFFGEKFSPGNGTNEKEKKNQNQWIKKFTEEWTQALTPRTKRRNDGFRFILGLSPLAVKDLTDSAKSVDQAMRDIWRETMALYKRRHGLESPADDLGWIAGAHHDTDNTHLHIVLFPTTLSGKPLRTNNGRSIGKNKGRINDLNDLIAMTNIAAEIYWREQLPFEKQESSYKKDLELNPFEEPKLPNLGDYKIQSGLPGNNEPPQEKKIEINTKLVNKKQEKEMEIEHGKIGILEEIQKKFSGIKGIRILKAYSAITMAWQNRQLKFGALTKLLDKKDGTLKETLEQEFGLENNALQRIIQQEKNLRSKKAQRALADWRKKENHWGHALLAFIAGKQEESTPETNLQIAKGRAALFEKSITSKDSEEKLKLIWKASGKISQEINREKKRTATYRIILKSFEALEKKIKGEPTNEDFTGFKNILKAIIKGSTRITLFNELQKEEAKISIKKTGDSFTVREEEREWDFKNNEFLPSKNKGKPWPNHLDPDTIIEPLRRKEEMEEIELPKIKKQKFKENIQREDWEGDENEGTIELFFRRKSIQRRKRKRRAKNNIQQTEPDLEMEGPEIGSP